AHVHLFTLTTNMRVTQDDNQKAKVFSEYLLRIGNGTEPTIENNLIRLPDEIVIPLQNSDDSIKLLLDTIYPNLSENASNTTFVTERAILTPLNSSVDEINEQIVHKFLVQKHTYYSFDSVPDDNLNLYPIEYLNSLIPQGLPPHELTLKVGVPIMLLRNLDPVNGLCNRTRLICRCLQQHTIDTEIATGEHQGKR
ncbi:7568_t:CDS:1, partial [Racocetra persica]